MANIQEWLEEGLRRHKAGDLAAAESHYRKVLDQQPKQADALYLLGRLKYQAQQFEAAEPLLRTAVKADPNYMLAELTLALVCEQRGKDEEAVHHFRRAATLDPKSAQPVYNLANLLARTGQAGEAEKLFRKAIELEPTQAAAYNNLGLLLQRRGHWNEALEILAKAIEVDPICVAAYSNRSGLLKQRGRIDDAIGLQRRAVERNPQSAEARTFLARLLRESGDFAAAEEQGRRAVACAPQDFTAINELGKTLQLIGKTEDAEQAYVAALTLNSTTAETWNNLGTAVLKQQRLEEAFGHYEKAVELDPGYAAAWSNLGNAHLDCDDIPEARRCLTHAARLQKNPAPWDLRKNTLCPTLYESVAEIHEVRGQAMEALQRFRSAGETASLRDLIDSACQPSFNFPFHGMDERPLKEAFAAAFLPSFDSSSIPVTSSIPHVGVIITHDEWAFRRSVGTIFNHLDSNVVRVTIVCSPAGIETLRRFFTNPRVGFLPMSVEIERTVNDIRVAGFDILYHWEVATTPLSYFLPFLRLAPVQVTSWGIQVTTGIPAIDYYVSSSLVETEDSDQFYSEKLYRLGTMMSCQPRVPTPRVLEPRESYGLFPKDHIYLCPQQLGKFHPDFDPILRELLERDPAGKIVVVSGKHPKLQEKLLQRWRSTLGNVANQVHFVPRLQGERYTSLFAHADVLLDPIHFGGVNTTYDALSLNKAVLTLPSPFFRCRATLGCYRQIGYEECIARSTEDYVDKALRLGTDPEYRRSLERELATRTDRLFDHQPSIGELQEFFVRVHTAAKRGTKTDWLPQPSSPFPPTLLQTVGGNQEPFRTSPAADIAADPSTHFTRPFAELDLTQGIAVAYFEPVDPAYAAVSREIAELVGCTLETLGCSPLRLVGSVDPKRLNVLVCPEGVFAPRLLEGKRYLAYRVTPLRHSQGNLSAVAMGVLRNATEVWDYSTEHLRVLERLGLRSVRHVPVGFHEKERKLARADQDIDVVLLGSRTARQAEIYHRLATQCRVEICGNQQGEARNRLLSRGKVILSVAGWDGAAMDEPGISYLLANRCVVVAEASATAPFDHCIASAEYDGLVECCLRLVASQQERYRQAKAGFEFIKQRSMADILRSALGLEQLARAPSTAGAAGGTTE